MKNILHVEDNSDFHVYVQTMLSDIVNVTSVFSAEELKETMLDAEYDLFILDMILEDSSGASIATALRKKYPKKPIIILSAHEVVSGLGGCVDAVFNKTVLDFDELINTVKRLLNIA